MTEPRCVWIETFQGVTAFTVDNALAYVRLHQAGASDEELNAWVLAMITARQPPYDEEADRRAMQRVQLTELSSPYELPNLPGLPDIDGAWWINQN